MKKFITQILNVFHDSLLFYALLGGDKYHIHSQSKIFRATSPLMHFDGFWIKRNSCSRYSIDNITLIFVEIGQ